MLWRNSEVSQKFTCSITRDFIFAKDACYDNYSVFLSGKAASLFINLRISN